MIVGEKGLSGLVRRLKKYHASCSVNGLLVSDRDGEECMGASTNTNSAPGTFNMRLLVAIDMGDRGCEHRNILRRCVSGIRNASCGE